MVDGTTGVSGALTDGTGISRLTASKVFKDFVLDLCLSGSAALVVANIPDVGSAINQPNAVAFALVGSTIRVIFRFVVRWAQS